jgi:hypothetical protein
MAKAQTTINTITTAVTAQSVLLVCMGDALIAEPI